MAQATLAQATTQPINYPHSDSTNFYLKELTMHCEEVHGHSVRERYFVEKISLFIEPEKLTTGELAVETSFFIGFNLSLIHI